MKAITEHNVLGAQEYRSMAQEVLAFAGKTVARTLGPCANTSIIEEMGPLVASKDGFHTIRRLRFHPRDAFANNILGVILQMSHRMVSIVGDGSSSAVVAAWKFAEVLNKYGDLKTMRPRALNKLMDEALDRIVDHIEKNAKRPTPQEIPDIMFNTAMVSTNGDEAFSEMIRQIYLENSENVQFNVIKGRVGEDCGLEYHAITGYKAKYYYMLDPVFHNTKYGFIGKGVATICFDMALDYYHYDLIHSLASIARKKYGNDVEVLIVAPSYSQDLCDRIKRDTQMDRQLMEAKQLRHYRVRYMKILAVNAAQRAEYMDFCMLAGSTPIASTDLDGVVDQIEGTTTIESEDVVKRLNEAVGRIGRIETHLDRYSIFSEFNDKDEELYERTMTHVGQHYEEQRIENEGSAYPSASFMALKQRYEKLQCRTIEVIIGAPNRFELELRFDAAEDACRACESVIGNGYVVGGNVAIMRAAIDTRGELFDDSVSREDRELARVVDLIYETFVNVACEVFANKYSSDGFDSLEDEKKKEVLDIIYKCVMDQTYYDLIEDKYSEDIINSARTDIEILRGAISLCMTLMTANQYIATNTHEVEDAAVK